MTLSMLRNRCAKCVARRRAIRSRLSANASMISGKTGKPCRLGIMGGTFDPIHNGHLACAEQAREDLGLDVILFIPTGNPVFKRGQRIAPASDRLAMCRAAIADNPYFDVSDIEISAWRRYPIPSIPFVRFVVIFRPMSSCIFWPGGRADSNQSRSGEARMKWDPSRNRRGRSSRI